MGLIEVLLGTSWGNTLRIWETFSRHVGEHSGNIVGTRQEHQKSKARENLLQGKTRPLGCIFHHHWLSRISTPECVCHCFCPRLMARARSCVSAAFVGPFPHRDRNYRIRSNFWMFYLITTSFIFGGLISLVKVFRLFRLERIFFMLTVWTQYVHIQHLI
jgi:hypothetical protein